MVDRVVSKSRARTNPDDGTLDKEPPDEPAAPRRRMSVADRERHIVDGAIAFFSERGLGGQIRELAAAIGVAHTLVYHYFPTKQALVDRVYEEVFGGLWKPEWETLLDSRELEVEEKFVRFYMEWTQTVITREVVRMLLFSGLTDHTISHRFFPMLAERLFPRLIRETRRYRGSSSRAKRTPREYELLMGLHGGIFHNGLRRFVYWPDSHVQLPLDDRDVIADRVRGYLHASLSLDGGMSAAESK
jgi:AcrR family transcriptional regulator